MNKFILPEAKCKSKSSLFTIRPVLMVDMDGSAALAATALIALGSLPALRRLVSARWTLRKPAPAIYEDVDGVASLEAMAAYARLSGRVFVAAFVCVLLGFALSVAGVVVAALTQQRESLVLPAWFFLILQLVDTARERESVARFNRACERRLGSLSFSMPFSYRSWPV
ncbi:hypothetical protein ASPZODRAFT_1715635 [Penicilliopsis zonata CBS 506.65]|uniref:Uncharacterized protein n=1 Tax=Penicilliopsis zonata CBS 506.65 TaxID=1073090 RepID=A0A1L9SKD3_9EURO|nr:hypothetical protein ASPZODRAFT_1715635 [Penicilliopsis zonata CBS 506.65]OJJ47561.1 hypothetical protein ASPZODRAFT_1715635 [Penicilliopsis zonata CBS 506.65]